MWGVAGRAEHVLAGSPPSGGFLVQGKVGDDQFSEESALDAVPDRVQEFMRDLAAVKPGRSGGPKRRRRSDEPQGFGQTTPRWS